mmetsp:Transcript_36227/g.69418  ORF Transcript_36227/g.69418 Transcript_36227/m.69418 type:complete len:397 (+) Transcript_36227:3801-4991(+)
MGEEEPADPKHCGRSHLQPFVEKPYALNHLLHIAGQRLQRRERLSQPFRWHLAYAQRYSNLLELCRHHHEPVHRLLDVREGAANHVQQVVDPAQLLAQHRVHAVQVLHRIFLLRQLQVEVTGKSLEDLFGGGVHSLFERVASPAPASHARLRVEERFQNGVGLLDLPCNVGVLVQAKHFWRADQRKLFDEGDEVRMPISQRHMVRFAAQLVPVLQDLGVVEIREQGHQEAAVLRVRHLAPVVALPARVRERVEGDGFVFVQEHLELAHGDAEVVLVEFVRDVPSDGAVASSLAYGAVEEAEAVQHLSPGIGLGALAEEVVVRYGVALVQPQQSGAKRLRGLGGNLDSSLQDADGEDVGRVGGEPEPELRVGVGPGELVLAYHLQLGEERLGQVAVH